MPKNTRFLAILLLLAGCQKEPTCWSVIRSIETKETVWVPAQNPYSLPIEPQHYYQEVKVTSQALDTNYQCGLTEKEIQRQCQMNSKVISQEQNKTTKLIFTYQPK